MKPPLHAELEKRIAALEARRNALDRDMEDPGASVPATAMRHVTSAGEGDEGVETEAFGSFDLDLDALDREAFLSLYRSKLAAASQSLGKSEGADVEGVLRLRRLTTELEAGLDYYRSRAAGETAETTPDIDGEAEAEAKAEGAVSEPEPEPEPGSSPASTMAPTPRRKKLTKIELNLSNLKRRRDRLMHTDELPVWTTPNATERLAGIPRELLEPPLPSGFGDGYYLDRDGVQYFITPLSRTERDLLHTAILGQAPPEKRRGEDFASTIFQLEIMNGTGMPAYWSPATAREDRLVVRTNGDLLTAHGPVNRRYLRLLDHNGDGSRSRLHEKFELDCGPIEPGSSCRRYLVFAASADDNRDTPLDAQDVHTFYLDEEPFVRSPSLVRPSARSLPFETILAFERKRGAGDEEDMRLTIPRGTAVGTITPEKKESSTRVRTVFYTDAPCRLEPDDEVGYAPAVCARIGGGGRVAPDTLVELIGDPLASVTVTNPLASYDPRYGPDRPDRAPQFNICWMETWGHEVVHFRPDAAIGEEAEDGAVVLATGGAAYRLDEEAYYTARVRTPSPIVGIASPLVIAYDTTLISYDKSGEERWQLDLDEPIRGFEPLAGRYCALTDEALIFVSSSGSSSGSVVARYSLHGADTLVGGARFGLITARGEYVTLLGADAENLATRTLGEGSLVAVGFTADGDRLLLSDTQGRVHAFDDELQTCWSVYTDALVTALWGDERFILCGTKRGSVYLLARGGTVLYRRWLTDAPIIAITAVPSLFLVADKSGRLYGLKRPGTPLVRRE